MLIDINAIQSSIREKKAKWVARPIPAFVDPSDDQLRYRLGVILDEQRLSALRAATPPLGHEWKADTSLVGGRAAEHFRFRALAVGEARLRFQYRRAWESEAREERTFTVRVVPDK
jgi:Chagasin family peptidase inhibitor I42